MKKLIFLSLFFFSLSKSIFAQDNSKQAREHFGKYLDSKKFLELCIKSLPTLDECKLLFKGQNAYTYFGSIEDIKRQLNEELSKPFIKYEDLRIESFTTEDIQNNKGNYAGGMKIIADKLQPNIRFYNVNFLKNKDDKDGMKYQSVININGKWVFCPKPWRSFGQDK